MKHTNYIQKMEGLWGLILKAIICLLLAFTYTVATATEYYVSSSGSDADSGTSPGSAWQTIARVNVQDLDPIDRVLFEGGETFVGNLLIDASDSGTPGSPVIITSYGTGRATIDGEDGTGISVSDSGGIEIREINIVGSGPATNSGYGVDFFTDKTDGTKFEHIRIEQVDVSGFRKTGIAIRSDHSSLPGYRDVQITGCKSFDNGDVGIKVGGYYNNRTPALSHENILIADCEVYNNLGDPTKLNSHTGSGIIVSAVDGAVIEFCHAHHNGGINSENSGGPVGIWTWQSNNVTIRSNISHHNKTGGNQDGGGFDIDGGATNTLIEYNLSYENEGPGFLLAQFSGAPPFRNHVIRYNISYNDGRRNGNGGFLIWAGFGTSISNVDIYGNTVYLTVPVTGSPRPVRVYSGTYNNIKIRNNIFMTEPGLQLMRANGNLSSGQIHFQGNTYWTIDGTFEVEMGGNHYYSLAEWQGTGQEKMGGIAVGMHEDPVLVDPGSPVLPTDPYQLSTLTAYKAQPNSPVIDAGLDLQVLFGVDPGPHDFYGVPLPQGAALDIGAAEYTGSNPTPDIKANNLDGPVLIAPQDILSVIVELQAGGYSGVNADWWCAANTPFGWYYYNYNSRGWFPGFAVAYQGALSDLSTYEVLNMTDLPTGDYSFYFGVDMNMNGSVDMGQIYYDSVGVTIGP